MNKYLYHFCIIFWLAASAQPANATAREALIPAAPVHSATLLAAGNCNARANALASSYANATILSVTASGNSCTIVIRVKDSNGAPPRIIRKTVPG